MASSSNPAISYKKIQGITMGTSYHITYKADTTSIPQEQIDSILVAINQSVSTYIDDSTISQLNKPSTPERIDVLENGKMAYMQRVVLPADPHFLANHKKSLDIWRESSGHFDPTVMPLVNYWGFGYTSKKPVTQTDSSKVKSLLDLVGLGKITLEHDNNTMTIIKPPGSEIDYSAIAKGYAVDQLGEHFENNNIHDYFVEIGGEVLARGKNPKGEFWRVGLNKPVSEATPTDILEIIALDNMSLASSGNYRIYHVVDNKKYGHEINPLTGYPEQNEILGVSILSESCMEADAVATACMIMGLESAITFVEERLHLEGCFFYSDENGEIVYKATPGFQILQN